MFLGILKDEIMLYTLEEHKHRLAYWAASNAANRGVKGLTVENGKKLIEKIKLRKFIDSPNKLPQNFDLLHARLRKKLIKFAKSLIYEDEFEIKDGAEVIKIGIFVKGVSISDGVAAKLINVYLKVILICGGYENHKKVQQLHPPIDSILLKGLVDSKYKEIFEREGINKSTRWTKLDSKEYEKIIEIIQIIQAENEEPLWMIEKYWMPEKVSR